MVWNAINCEIRRIRRAGKRLGRRITIVQLRGFRNPRARNPGGGIRNRAVAGNP